MKPQERKPIRLLLGIVVALIFAEVAVGLLFILKLASDRQALDQLFCHDLQYGMSLEQAREVM